MDEREPEEGEKIEEGEVTGDDRIQDGLVDESEELDETED